MRLSAHHRDRSESAPPVSLESRWPLYRPHQQQHPSRNLNFNQGLNLVAWKQCIMNKKSTLRIACPISNAFQHAVAGGIGVARRIVAVSPKIVRRILLQRIGSHSYYSRKIVMDFNLPEIRTRRIAEGVHTQPQTNYWWEVQSNCFHC